MTVFENRTEFAAYLTRLRQNEVTLGFVPTMGALHDGHSALVKEGLAGNDIVVVSIFVNPTQFNTTDDLVKYPRTLERDVALLNTISNSRIVVFAPSPEAIYGDDVSSQHFDFGGLESEMEGQYRPGHFDGVGTVIKRLFNIINPDNAYFGKKDFQQLLIIKKLVALENLQVNIIGCDIHRTKDGLAMSSRNERLSKTQRSAAPFIYRVLQTAKTKFGTESALQVTDWVKEQFKNHEHLVLEYVLIADATTLKTIVRKSTSGVYRIFIAVYAGDVRLIDNIALN